MYEVFYCHPSGDNLGDIRKKHIENMAKSCDKAGVHFTEISSNLPTFFANLQKNSLHRLVILDDLCHSVFKIPQAMDLFNVAGHHFK